MKYIKTIHDGTFGIVFDFLKSLQHQNQAIRQNKTPLKGLSRPYAHIWSCLEGAL